MRCLQCQSTDIVKDVRVVDHTDSLHKVDLKLEVYAKPDAWIFKEAHEGTLKANVCAYCGFVMLNVSVDDAMKLKKKQG
ncbi:MAG: hypothetical protein NE328_23965 [Lentisphaeraceae bacterium]|nr:hypothetical protein [Lentisphaeraceae bacterium]